MSERPILFSTPMVRAILECRKTQTRRVLKFAANVDAPAIARFHYGKYASYGKDGALVPLNKLGGIATKAFHDHHILCPYGQPGDRLWVRETAIIAPKRWNDGANATHKDADGDARIVQYLATHPNREGADQYKLKATPSIFMPRWASRIALMVANVRVERLQDISDDDAIAEGLRAAVGDGAGRGAGYKWTGVGYEGGKHGFFHTPHPGGHRCACKLAEPTPAQCAYHDLWDSLNGKKAPWASNPWVWVLTFKRVTP